MIYHGRVRRLALPLLAAAATAACVSVAPPPDPHGVYKPGQRLVVFVYQAPGPWIVTSGDSNIESAAQITPLGFAVQGLEDSQTLRVSKTVQQYLPRPRYDDELQDALMKELRTYISSSAVSAMQAGIGPERIQRWNRARNQYSWRTRYFQTDPTLPPPRDYSRAHELQDALVLDVNLSFGTTAVGTGQDAVLHPDLAASWRVYRGINSHDLWDHLNEDVDPSTMTIVDLETTPSNLTDRLQAMAPQLGREVGHEFARAFGLLGSTAPARGASAPPTVAVGASSGPAQKGLLPMSYLLSLSTGADDGSPLPPAPPPSAVPTISTAPAAAASPATPTPPSISSSTATPPAASTAAPASTATAVAPPSPAPAATAPASSSTPTPAAPPSASP